MNAKPEIKKNEFSLSKLFIKYRTIIILLVLVLIFTMLNGIFIHPTNVMNMLKRMSYVAIVSFGMTYIIVLGGLDLSVGSIAAVVGMSLSVMLSWGVPLPLALLICMAIALALGALNGIISVKGKIEPFLVTLATMNIYRGIALVITSGKPKPIVDPYFADIFGNGMMFGIIPNPILIMLMLFIISWFVFKKTKFGYYVRCIGGNAEAARVAGIPVEKVKIAAYIVSGGYACIAGFILAALMNSGLPNIGADLALDSISAVILGGTAIAGGLGTMWGTIGGTMIMGTLNSGMSLMGAQYPIQIFVKGVVIILAVLMDNALKSRKKL